MDDVIEIDLRKLILKLLASWKWIIGTAFVFGLAAFLYSFLQSNFYQAEAIIAITKPRYIANFDQQYQTINPGSPSNKALIDIVNGDSIISQVYDYWASEDKDVITYNNFRDNALSVESGSDNSTIVLKIKFKNPEEAASLVNYWAQISTKKINTLYSGADTEQLVFFDNQIEISSNNLKFAQDALVEFEKTDTSKLLQNELDSLLALQLGNIRKQQLLEYARLDANGILKLVEDYSNNSIVENSILQNFYVLQLRIYTDTGFEQTPIQFQISSLNEDQNMSVLAFKNLITDWSSVIESQIEEYQEQNLQIDELVLNNQMTLRELTNQRLKLESEYNIVTETYETMLRKQKEVRISSQEPHGDVQIASMAKVPEERMSHNTVRNTAIALVVGGVLAVFFVIFRDWFNQENLDKN